MKAIPLIHAEHMARVAAFLERAGIPSERSLERAGISPGLRHEPRGFVAGRSVWSLIGCTSRHEGLAEFLNAAKDIKPLPDDIVADIAKLQTRWSDETDVHAEPWSM